MNHFSRLSFAISTILIFPRDLIFFFTPSFTLSIRTFAHGADKVIRFFFWTWIVCFTCDFFLHDSLISTTNLYLRCSSHYSFVVHVISFVTCDPPPTHTHTWFVSFSQNDSFFTWFVTRFIFHMWFLFFHVVHTTAQWNVTGTCFSRVIHALLVCDFRFVVLNNWY